MIAVRVPRRLVVALVVGLATVGGGCVGLTTDSAGPIDIASPGSWTALAPLPTARQEVAVAALDGKIFVVGGFGENAEPVATVEVYDPAADRWDVRAPLPAPTHHAAAAVVNGRLFVVGGYTGGRLSWTATPTLYEYDPARNSWATRASMPTPRGGLAATALGGRLHALGGAAGDPTPAHEVYEPAADRWSAAPAMTTARDHLAAVAFAGAVWAIGGRRSFVGEQYASVEIYDPAAGSWRTGPPLPTGRGGLAAAALADRILVFGGESPLRIFSATEMFEVAGNRWIAKAPMPTPRHGIGAAVVDGRVYIPGGATRPGFGRTDVNERFEVR